MSRVWLAILLVALLFTSAPAAEMAPANEDDGTRIDLPLTIEKLWYRSGGKRREGYLTVSERGLEFFAAKKAIDIPLGRIQYVSLGTMKWDVDTDWIVLAVGVASPYDIVGLRDGTKWGFGGRTEEIYYRLRQVFRQLGAAQFRAPAGFQAYEIPDQRCAFTIPEGWSTYMESLVVISDRSSTGSTILSDRTIRRIETDSDGHVKAVDDLELLDAILAGESIGFFVERDRVSRGMDCRGFSKSARERVLAGAREDFVFGDGFEVVDAPAVSESTVGHCRALRILGRSRRPDGAEVVLELHAVANGGTLYTFGLRALADRYERFREPYAASLATVKFSVALAP